MGRSRTLFRTSLLTVVDVRCPARPPAAGDVEVEPAFAAVLPRRGCFVYHAAGRRVAADPTVGFLLDKGAEHRTTHPAAGGDRNTVIQLTDGAAAPFLTSAATFGAAPLPLGLDAFLLHHEMLAAIRSGSTTPLEVDEWGMATIRLLAGTGTRRPAPLRPLARRAQAYLAAHYADDADLRSVAGAVGVSPHHLSRVFSATTGRTLSAHRTELRLRHVIDRLADGACDLAAVAVDAGFFDHAHMSRTVKRHTGATPSRLRELLAA